MEELFFRLPLPRSSGVLVWRVRVTPILRFPWLWHLYTNIVYFGIFVKGLYNVLLSGLFFFFSTLYKLINEFLYLSVYLTHTYRHTLSFSLLFSFQSLFLFSLGFFNFNHLNHLNLSLSFFLSLSSLSRSSLSLYTSYF